VADKSVVEARKGFQAYIAGAPFRVRRGARFWSDDPIVKDNPEQFGDLKIEESPGRGRQAARAKVLAGTTETADAAPGTPRTRTVPDPDVSKGDPNPQGSDAPVDESAESADDGTKDDSDDVDTTEGRKPAAKPARRTPAKASPSVDTGKSTPASSGGKAGSDA
jgi:hypothetical protein